MRGRVKGSQGIMTPDLESPTTCIYLRVYIYSEYVYTDRHALTYAGRHKHTHIHTAWHCVTSTAGMLPVERCQAFYYSSA